MAMDIFSSFDDHNKVLLDMNVLMWITVMAITLMPTRKMWSKLSSKSSMSSILGMIGKDLVSRTKLKQMAGGLATITSTLMLVIMINLMGLSPYTFSVTSHISVNLSLALPLWLGSVLMSVMFNLPSTLSHLLPLGSPWYLAPFLCIIELLSMMVRPFTLAVRLTANLSTGHILMALLGMGVTSATPWMASLLTLLGMFYCIFEIAVCMIQGYIFSLLPTLYADEHPDAN